MPLKIPGIKITRRDPETGKWLYKRIKVRGYDAKEKELRLVLRRRKDKKRLLEMKHER